MPQNKGFHLSWQRRTDTITHIESPSPAPDAFASRQLIRGGEGFGVRCVRDWKAHIVTKNKLPPYAPADLWKHLKLFAREMRQTPTPAEELLWQQLRNRQLNGLKFRRQFAIERFIVDFVCLDRRLIVEVDGSVHDQQQEYDELRQLFLEAIGFRVLRFSNDAVLHTTEAVVEAIVQHVADQS